MRALALWCLAVLLAGCGGSVAGGPHEMRIADESDPSSLNPLLAHDQDTIGYDLLWCQTLVGLDARNRLVPVLVTRVPSRANGDVSADGRTIVYHLKPDVRFADGTALESTDVAFTYRAILDPHNNVLSQDNYRRIEWLRTPNARTVVIHLKKRWDAAVSVLFAQADFAFGILPSRAFHSTDVTHAPWDEHPYGTGPFYVVDWKRGDRVVLAPNPYFSPRPKLRRLVLLMMPSMQTGFVALRTHEVDVAPLDPQLLAQARSAGTIRIVRTPENATVWLSLQTQAVPTGDVRVRRAIAWALDLRALRKTFDEAYPAAGSFLPPVLSDVYDGQIAPIRHDAARAAALLDAAGWRLRGGVRSKNGVSLAALLVIQAGNELDGRLAAVVQQELAKIGMRVSIKAYQVALFNAPSGPIRNGHFTLAIDGWLGGSDPEQSVVFTCAQANVDGDNISRYCNPQFERFFADQATARDPSERRRDFVRMQQLVRAGRPVIPLYYETYFEGLSPRVSGFARNMLRYPVDPQRWDAGR